MVLLRCLLFRLSIQCSACFFLYQFSAPLAFSFINSVNSVFPLAATRFLWQFKPFRQLKQFSFWEFSMEPDRQTDGRNEWEIFDPEVRQRLYRLKIELYCTLCTVYRTPFVGGGTENSSDFCYIGVVNNLCWQRNRGEFPLVNNNLYWQRNRGEVSLVEKNLYWLRNRGQFPLVGNNLYWLRNRGQFP